MGDQGRTPVEDIDVRYHFPPDMHSQAISIVSISRVDSEIQLDLGRINIKRLVEHLKDPDQREKTIDVQVAFSAQLSMKAFLQLHHEVNRFYDILKRDGLIDGGNDDAD